MFETARLLLPAQFLMTKVRKLMQRKSLKGCGLVSLTHFRYRCLSIGIQGMSGTLTPKKNTEQQAVVKTRHFTKKHCKYKWFDLSDNR